MFFDDIKRGYTQWAGFVSVDFDLVPKTLTLTGGVRYYSMDTFEKGAYAGSFGCEIHGIYDSGTTTQPFVPPNPCVSTPATYKIGGEYDTTLSNVGNLDADRLQKTFSGAKGRANLTWHIRPDMLAYSTRSQGFRPGGFNRGAGLVPKTPTLSGIFSTPTFTTRPTR